MVDPKYSVSWDGYQRSICNGLSGLQQRGEFVDMTLAADGHRVMAHKMVLSLVSPYIRDLVDSTDCNHPVIFLSKVSHQTLQSILEYAYTGEVVVADEGIQEFLLACKELRIRGLEGSTIDGGSAQQAICTDMDMDIQQANSDVSTSQQITQQVNSNTDNQKVNSNTDMEPQTVHSAEILSFDNNNDSASSDDDVDNKPPAFLKKPVSKPITKPSRLSNIISNSNTSAAGLKFTISNQQSAQIVLNRFLYNHRHTRKNGESLWRCVNYTRPFKLSQRCRAFVVLKDNLVVQRSCSHNHAFHDDKILRRVRERNMFTSMTETQKWIEKKAQKNIEKNEAINHSISRPQNAVGREIEYIEMK